MNRIKKKDLLVRIENLEEAVSTLMMDRFINKISGIEIDIEKTPKGKATKKKEEKPTSKKRGRKPKKEVK